MPFKMSPRIWDTIKIMMLFLLAILLEAGHIYYNLEKNAVYYAMNTPHSEGIYPEIIELVDRTDLHDDFDYLFPPIYGTEEMQVDMDGFTMIYIHNEREKEDYMFASTDCLEPGSIYTFSQFYHPSENETQGLQVCFNKNCNAINAEKETFITFEDRPPEKSSCEISMSEPEAKELNEKIIDVLKPAWDQQHPPLINLQKLYDFLHYKEFNPNEE